MCRFALYLGPPIKLSRLTTQPENSIIHQSYDARERSEPLNGDGFGVAWYLPDLQAEPAIYRSIRPAWSDRNLFNLAPVSVSGCLLAHVRAATPGLPVTELNCHPFVRQRLALMHNGSVGGFRQLKRRLRKGLSDTAYHSIEGSTDSEHLLALMSDLFAASEESNPLQRLSGALVGAIERVESMREEVGVDEISFLNVAVTDGERAVVSRYVSHGSEAAHSLYFATGQLTVKRAEAEVVPEREGWPAAVVASEPLGPGDAWQRVPSNHLVVIAEDRTVDVRPMH